MSTQTISPNAHIRAATRDDIPEILQLLQICLAKTTGIPRSKEFWIWKHFENPFGESPCLLYIEDGIITGLRAFLRWNWTFDSKRLTAVRAVDTATHPDWQGQGIFSRLTTTLLGDLRAGGACFVFNTPNSSSLPGYLKMGWRIVTKVPLWIRPLHPISMLWKYATATESNQVATVQNSWPEDDLLHACLDRIFAANDFPERVRTLRSIAYINWRYRRIPGFSYFAAAESTGSDAAVGIARERIRNHLRELSITELLLNSDSIPCGAHVVEQLISRTSADYAIAVAADGTPEAKALKKCGFYNIGKRGPVFTFLELNPCAPEVDLLNWSNWRCSIGDLEIF